ncbi:LytTR family DNA-binding domain-containing protein [Cellulosilyticum sp. I15G10I2]|uniref:LytTR family DNA-binding domain-containing protein n=1 Tax=Cellulosilyticum sp. I15G10I2 TaxID=1892843 RepID=UPI00085C48EC|nr:LytTR family DNA-binding domain-containing protein [Cellulosilyticum sp. I15G10I2]
MKVTIDESINYLETEIIIKCSEVNEETQKLILMLKNSEKKIFGVIGKATQLIDPHNILYFESVDKKTFIYTKEQVLESPLRLYEVESKLSDHDFFRASKSTIINMSKIEKLTPKLNGKLEVLLENNEKIIVSRQYVPILKEILGL